jgi:predicted acylesterase/phospholipase RssA
MNTNKNVTTDYFSHCWGVFEGGGVRAAAHAGAYSAARQAGVVFGRVAGTSAGSIVAALIAAGASHEYISQALKNMDLASFLGTVQPRDAVFTTVPRWLKLGRYLTWGKLRLFADVAMHSGMYSSYPLQDWLETHLNTLLRANGKSIGRGPVRFAELQIPLHIVATDLTTGQPKVWSSETTPEDSVAAAVRCSCSIPFFYQAVSHQDSVFVDGGAVSNLPSFVFTKLLADGKGRSVLSRIMAFRLVEDEVQQRGIEGLKDFALRLSNASVDGASHIQMSLQPHVYQISIPTGSIRSTDFNEVGEAEKKKLHDIGSKAVRDFIASERLIVRKSTAAHPHQGFDEKILLLVQELQGCTKEFFAIGPSTYWLDFVFPSVLALARRGINIVVIAPATRDIKEERRRWLLSELGAEIIDPRDMQLFTGFVFDSGIEKACALLSTFEETNDSPANPFKAERVRLYTKDSDPAVLEMLKEKLSLLWKPKPNVPKSLPYSACADVTLFELLKTISHYVDAKFRLADIQVSDAILVLQQSLKEFKLLQIKYHITDLIKNDRELFELVQVSLPSGKFTIITPPVLEQVGENLILIDGHARLFYCLNNGIKTIRAVIVDNVKSPLPAQNPRPLSTLKLVSSTTSVDEMYSKMDESLFRRIEQAVHPYPN